MENPGWELVSDDESLEQEDGWNSWDDEPRVAMASPAKRGRQWEAAGSSSRARVRQETSPARALTVDDPDALNCGVCFLPLRRPIFQCKVGHMVCSTCHDKLKASKMCHMCRIPTDYSRCHGMEDLVECIRIQCPNAAYGCTTRLAYYDQCSHCQKCPHAPCHCPGQGCGFIGSTAVLLDHITGVHGWPTTKIKAFDSCNVYLRDGFNFLIASGDTDTNGSQGAKTAPPTGCNQWLFLVNVVQQPLDRVISMLCIHPHGNADAKNIECNLSYSTLDFYRGGQYHSQCSFFRVAFTDLSSGLPDPNECFRFVLPNCVVVYHGERSFEVKARIIVN